MSELLRKAARHLRRTAASSDEPAAVVVLMLSPDGTANTIFFGNELDAGKVAMALPDAAADVAHQLNELSRQAQEELTAAEIAAEIISRARRASNV